MCEYEKINQQLHDYYSFVTSIINFLQKYITQFHKILINYSFFLKHFHKKSIILLTKTSCHNDFMQKLHRTFSSLIQSFDDEHSQLEQRILSLKTLQFNIESLKQQINSSKFLKQKTKLNKYTNRILHLNRYKKRQYLYKLVQQIRKYDKLTSNWKDNLDNTTLQIINLLYKLASHSLYKVDIKSIKAPSSSLLISHKQLSCSIELGSGDQLPSKVVKEIPPNENEQDENQISNSNNALMILSNLNDGNRSVYSTDIDETMIENNRFDDDNDDDDDRWIKLVEQNDIQSDKTILSLSTEETLDENESLNKQPIHLSDISYTTDYYSQNESD